jgi:hypothetical protein
LQVKFSVFWAYIRSVGIWVSIAILIFYILNTTASVGANFWLSEWSNDAGLNGTIDRSQRDLRLGVYGALGLAQGELVVLIAITGHAKERGDSAGCRVG